ncbi:MAG: 4Fe-4S dicluster domain-containing protein, partial [Kiloniellales bacterium]|nr:4Fe-4S dicluster domain-containing protein [Kiloniellales bacterium]
MQTNFTLAQLADPAIAESEQILRKCVHCGFCTATCPTFLLQGDELDSPRGRIYMIKSVLEEGRAANKDYVTHIDRCLSCLSCMTTCPSGVHYMHLVDHARMHIEETFKRSWGDRLLRSMLAYLLPYPMRFRLALMGGQFAKPIFKLTDGLLKRLGVVGETGPTEAGFWARLRALVALVPPELKGRGLYDRPQTVPAEAERKARVALLSGCANPALAPEINEATVRLLTRLGIEVVIPEGAGCCGALVHHMGRENESLDAVRANIDA